MCFGRCFSKSWVNDYQFSPFCHSLADVMHSHGVGLSRVSPDNQKNIRVLIVAKIICHYSPTKGVSQTGYGRGVSETGAMVKIDHAQGSPHELVN